MPYGLCNTKGTSKRVSIKKKAFTRDLKEGEKPVINILATSKKADLIHQSSE